MDPQTIPTKQLVSEAVSMPEDISLWSKLSTDIQWTEEGSRCRKRRGQRLSKNSHKGQVTLRLLTKTSKSFITLVIKKVKLKVGMRPAICLSRVSRNEKMPSRNFLSSSSATIVCPTASRVRHKALSTSEDGLARLETMKADD